MQTVPTPFGKQRVGQCGEAADCKDAQLPRSRVASARAATIEAAVQTDAAAAKILTKVPSRRTKPMSKRPCRREGGAEDSGRLFPPPAKRCRMLEAGDPTAEMRLLKAIVINLERRPDRMAGTSERLRLQCPWLEHSRFTACDGRREVMSLDEVVLSWNTGSNVVYQKKRAIRKGWNDLDSYQVRQLDLSPGERGCALSHIRAWRRCLECAGDSNKPLVVLEDDAAPTSEFTAVLRRALASLPADADLLYLGYSQAAEWRREVSENLVESEYVWTTVGYMVWPSGARKMLSRLPVDGPVDNWMAALGAAGDLKAYAVRPKVVLQADAWNVNSDVAHSDEHYWGANSDIHHSDAFYWGTQASPTAGSGPGVNPLGQQVDRSNTIWADIDEDSEEDSEDSASER